LHEEDITAAASVTRNPAVLGLMHKSFSTVSPDITAENPLHLFENNPTVQELTELYAAHVDAPMEALPFALRRYGDGLYGQEDPGVALTQLPVIAGHPGNGVIMVATNRRTV
jgi:hypothetical protein